jgi:hypothetical protein
MPQVAERDALGLLLDDIAAALTPEAARVIARWRVSPPTQARLDELADKCNEGELTPEERSEYESVVKAGNIIAIVQAKARRYLKDVEA